MSMDERGMPMSDMVKQMNYAIGVDIGGTKIIVALVNEKGQIEKQLQFATKPERGAESIIFQICENIEQLKLDVPKQAKIRGIGVVSAGILDDLTIVLATNLGWHNVPIGELIKRTCNLPVVLGNDANLSAVAEYVWGTKKEVEDVIYITVSTGIGAGIVSNGQLIKGISNSAGEFGHISMDLNGERCGCGNIGCLELYCSGTAIAKMANQTLAPLTEGHQWSSKDVLEQASAGHEGATQVVEKAAFYLANGIVSMIHLFNPSQIVLGGGVLSENLILFNRLFDTIKDRALPDLLKRTTIRRTELGKEIAVLGAAGIFFMDK